MTTENRTYFGRTEALSVEYITNINKNTYKLLLKR